MDIYFSQFVSSGSQPRTDLLGLPQTPKHLEPLFQKAPVSAPQPFPCLLKVPLGRASFPVPHRTPVLTPGNQFCTQPHPSHCQNLLLFSLPAARPHSSKPEPCPASSTPFPTVPEATPVPVTAGSREQVPWPCVEGGTHEVLCHLSACTAALLLGITTPK